MLKHLYIKNFTLISELKVDFECGFSTITGETGAGKSIILGALGLVMGQRADVKSIKQGSERCVIEAHFDISKYQLQELFTSEDLDYDEEDCIIRREINANGKSRAFLNDSPISLSVLKTLGEHLIDIHSQHQNLLLSSSDFQLSTIDIIADSTKFLTSYKESYTEYKDAISKLKLLEEQTNRDREREDFLRFQYEELTEARLIADEQEILEAEQQLMSHAEEIKSSMYNAISLLDNDNTGVLSQLGNVRSSLNSSSDKYAPLSEIAERVEACYIELKDLISDLSLRVEDIEFEPKRLEEIDERLNLIYTLQNKYKVDSVSALLEIYENIKIRLSQIDNSDEELTLARVKVEGLKVVCKEKALRLTEVRSKSAKQIEKALIESLKAFGMEKVRFEIVVEPCELTVSGADKVSYFFSANSSSPLQPVSSVASGGEIARVMLSLKAMTASAMQLPTIIFDEIDTGVSGRVAEKMAHIMADMGKVGTQVIAITHLPQIAALGSVHYQVSKSETNQGTESKMARLSAEERITEIAKMLSGSNITDAALQNAKSLLVSSAIDVK